MNNQILPLIGALVSFRNINRELLASKLKMSRPNMISAFNGRRTLPDEAWPNLRVVLHLDEDFRFQPNFVQKLTLKDSKRMDLASINRNLNAIMERFTKGKIEFQSVIIGVGEDNVEKKAFLFVDGNNTHILIQCVGYLNLATNINIGILIDKKKAIEISIEDFDEIYRSGDKLSDFKKILAKAQEMQNIVTWSRLKDLCYEKEIDISELFSAINEDWFEVVNTLRCADVNKSDAIQMINNYLNNR